MMAFTSTLPKEFTMFDHEDINAILNDFAEKGILEPMVEPIDEDTCHPFEWAEVVGIEDEIFEEMYPHAEEMMDEHGKAWLVG
jgi:hypothetical protein